MAEVFNVANLVSLGCVLGLVLVLGGGVAVMLLFLSLSKDGVRGLVEMARQWVDRK